MAEVFKYALRIQGGIDAATAWLVAAAAVLALALLVNPVTLRPAQERFRRRSVLGKVATVAVFCALAWCGGGKNDGDRGSPNPVNPGNVWGLSPGVRPIIARNRSFCVDFGPGMWGQAPQIC